MDQIKGVLAFVAAASEQSFTAAARTLDVSPQAVAGSIARLETGLSVRLFNRTTRSLSLTDEGQVFFARIAPTLAEFQDAIAATRDSSATPSGVLRVTTGAAFGRHYLMPLLPAFHKQYPSVRLDISMNDNKVDLIADGFDVAIRGGTIADSSLITRRVCSLAMVCVASPAYLKKFGPPATPEALTDHKIIALRFLSGAMAAWDFRVRSKAVSFEPKAPALTLSDTAVLADAAIAGMGIARMALHFAWPHLVAGRLKLVLHGFNDPGAREMVIHYPHRAHVAPRVKAFVDFMLVALQREPSLRATLKDAAPYVAQPSVAELAAR
jgi:DNA-binding transcriptional LysR family regulator